MDNDRNSFGFVREPSGDLYRVLLNAGLDGCEVLGLVYQNVRVGSYQKPVEALHPMLLDESEVSEWPGTKRMSGRALLRRYKFTPETVGVVAQLAQSLFDWQFPALPEDVHLLRADGTVWLASIAHERDAWLELTDDEFASLRNQYADLAGAIAPEADRRSFITRLWQEHLTSRFPEGLADEEIGEGVSLAYLDSTVAGCISTFVSDSSKLDQDRLQILRTSWFDLDEASESFTGPTNAYFHRLWRMVDLTLAFHDIDPFAHLRGEGEGNSSMRKGSPSRRS